MPLAPGTRLGPYEVVAAAGVGGMGEVYRASDTSLKRTVALKVLPESVAKDADRLARFQREAEVLASLNHPNIAAIFGIEASTSTRALIMEFVEGPTLADRITSGPLPFDEALPIAAQIADALEAAHERGIIHRDLKPANIKVRPDGTVKVLDFGLAKAIAGSEDPASIGRPDRGPLEPGPTMTSPAMTAMGVILGTASYMSPEQARGKPVDRRADIWAFGCVLYEMLTAKRAFPGDGITDVIAAVITRDPDFTALPASTPAHVRTVLARCFVKDPKQRMRDIGEARLQLLGATGPVEAAVLPPVPTTRRSPLTAVLAGALVLSLAVLAYTQFKPDAQRTASTSRVTINFTGAERMHKAQPQPSLAFSPDGQTIVFTASGPEGSQLHMRRLDDYQVTPIPGTGDGRQAFFSPDGKWIGFVALNVLKKVPLSLGPPTSIVTVDGGFHGATWTDRNEIVYSVRAQEWGLYRVSADGGTPTLVSRESISYPDALPGGNAVLVTLDNPGAVRSAGELIVAAVSLDSGTMTKVLDGGTYPRWAPTGHVLFLRDGALMAATLNPTTLVAGDARVAVVTDTFMDPAQAAGNYAVSASGALAYAPGSPADFERGFVTVDPSRPDRPVVPLGKTRRYFGPPRLSPDGARLVTSELAWVGRLALVDLLRDTVELLTTGGLWGETNPVWSADSQSIIFRGNRRVEGAGIFRIDASAGSTPTLLLSDPRLFPTAWSEPHKAVVVTLRQPSGDLDLGLLALEPTVAVRPLLATPFAEQSAVLSSDNRFVAYQSNRSGSTEVYVATFPDMAHTRRVSLNGGLTPAWRPGTHQLYFRRGNRILASQITPGQPLTATDPVYVADYTSVIPTGFFSVMRDGRIIMLDGIDQGASSSLHVVLNWFEELRAKVR